ncbi:hypothetical protein [Bacillus suaedaesalsae]|uniref:Uncharacterized protein n=1 Tax=Bacillus suaedaesalsae TaxID=2810349 RepID=A0ABS2DII0_9BACI|nr:hypothetical protein [Bacillus suaedaesalsae]MBM6618304.1 hypothetical protein [Bacillus suaedaesalsae]
MHESMKIYHRTGSQILITNIPTCHDGSLSFEIMSRLQKQIDEINAIAEPKSTYEFKST